MKIILLNVLCAITFTQAQSLLPFASTNNTIELSVANSSKVNAENITVEITNAPSWIKFTNPRQTEGRRLAVASGQAKSQIPNLKSREASITSFTFSIDKSAPINKPHTLKFIISSPTGEKWTKEIAVQVSAPEKFELFQNYPNPFNPSTTISFQLPVSGKISLTVYDIIGREVAILFDGVKEAGFYEEKFNAASFASGIYVYQVSFKNQKGEQQYFRKKMSLIK